jgi:hypothetical protein
MVPIQSNPKMHRTKGGQEMDHHEQEKQENGYKKTNQKRLLADSRAYSNSPGVVPQPANPPSVPRAASSRTRRNNKANPHKNKNIRVIAGLLLPFVWYQINRATQLTVYNATVYDSEKYYYPPAIATSRVTTKVQDLVRRSNERPSSFPWIVHHSHDNDEEDDLGHHDYHRPPPLLLQAGQGTTATHAVYKALCHLGVPTLHYSVHCNMVEPGGGGGGTEEEGNSTSVTDGDVTTTTTASSAQQLHERLVLLTHQFEGMPRLNISQCDDVEVWMEQVKNLVDELLIDDGGGGGGGVVGALTDTPYSFLIPYIQQASLRIRGISPVILLTERDPETWAMKRQTKHGQTWWCRDMSMLNSSSSAPWNTTATTTTTTLTTTVTSPLRMDYFGCIERMRPKLLAQHHEQQQVRQEQYHFHQPTTQFPRSVPVTPTTTSTTTTKATTTPSKLGCHLFATTIQNVPQEILRSAYQADLDYLRPKAAYRIDMFEQTERLTKQNISDQIRQSIPFLFNYTNIYNEK